MFPKMSIFQMGCFMNLDYVYNTTGGGVNPLKVVHVASMTFDLLYREGYNSLL